MSEREWFEREAEMRGRGGDPIFLHVPGGVTVSGEEIVHLTEKDWPTEDDRIALANGGLTRPFWLSVLVACAFATAVFAIPVAFLIEAVA